MAIKSTCIHWKVWVLLKDSLKRLTFTSELDWYLLTWRQFLRNLINCSKWNNVICTVTHWQNQKKIREIIYFWIWKKVINHFVSIVVSDRATEESINCTERRLHERVKEDTSVWRKWFKLTVQGNYSRNVNILSYGTISFNYQLSLKDILVA